MNTAREVAPQIGIAVDGLDYRVAPRPRIFPRLEMYRDRRIGQPLAHFSFNTLQEIVSALRRPRTRHEHVHQDKTARCCSTRAQRVVLL